jgi:hypothetical protein
MKRSLLSALLVASILTVSAASADTLSFDFSSDTGATIKFTGSGDTIEFPNTGAYDFTITSTTFPSLGGLQGNISGTFVVGAIATPFTGMEQASVSTSDGTFSVSDGAGGTLSASLNWYDIFVYNSLVGGLNAMGSANLTDVTYDGGVSDLIDFAGGSEQTVVLTFQFSPMTKRSLGQLMTDGQVNSTSYSGSASADTAPSVPEPSTIALLITAGMGLLCGLLRRVAT